MGIRTRKGEEILFYAGIRFFVIFFFGFPHSSDAGECENDTRAKGERLIAGGSHLRQLTRGYTREPAVIADIASLRKLSRSDFRKRLEIVDYQQPDCPRLESLVYFLREFYLRGEAEAAWQIAEILSRRIIRTIRRRLARWRRLPLEQFEEIEDNLTTTLYTEWFSLDPGQEFWEVRFAVCLERTISDELARHDRVARHETHLGKQEDDESGELDPWEAIPDTPTIDAETKVIMQSALDYLPEPLRTAFYLYHYADWTEEHIARHLGVVSRSVRNYLRRAEQHLEQWRQTEGERP